MPRGIDSIRAAPRGAPRGPPYPISHPWPGVEREVCPHSRFLGGGGSPAPRPWSPRFTPGVSFRPQTRRKATARQPTRRELRLQPLLRATSGEGPSRHAAYREPDHRTAEGGSGGNRWERMSRDANRPPPDPDVSPAPVRTLSHGAWIRRIACPGVDVPPPDPPHRRCRRCRGSPAPGFRRPGPGHERPVPRRHGLDRGPPGSVRRPPSAFQHEGWEASIPFDAEVSSRSPCRRILPATPPTASSECASSASEMTPAAARSTPCWPS